MFYAFDQSAGTLYTSADGGATFTAETGGGHRDALGGHQFAVAAPHGAGRAGDLWLTGGDGSLYHSTDGGKTFAKDASVGTVATVGFGKAAPCASQHCAGYPAIYLAGMSAVCRASSGRPTAGASWTRINTDAQQWGWIGQCDHRRPGRVRPRLRRDQRPGNRVREHGERGRAMTRGNLLVDTIPAGCWEDAFPVGNGRHGALVPGHPGAERVIVTHSTADLAGRPRCARRAA